LSSCFYPAATQLRRFSAMKSLYLILLSPENCPFPIIPQALGDLVIRHIHFFNGSGRHYLYLACIETRGIGKEYGL
jgi:hypothetical protein